MVYAAGSVRLLCDVLDHASGEVLATEQLISTSMMRSSWCTELQIDIHRFDVCDCDPETSWRYRTLLGVVNSATTAADALAQDDNSDGFDTADESETRDLPPPIIALTVQYTPSSELTNVVRVLMRPVQVVYSPTGTCRWHPYPDYFALACVLVCGTGLASVPDLRNSACRRSRLFPGPPLRYCYRQLGANAGKSQPEYLACHVGQSLGALR